MSLAALAGTPRYPSRPSCSIRSPRACAMRSRAGARGIDSIVRVDRSAGSRRAACSPHRLVSEVVVTKKTRSQPPKKPAAAKAKAGKAKADEGGEGRSEGRQPRGAGEEADAKERQEGRAEGRRRRPTRRSPRRARPAKAAAKKPAKAAKGGKKPSRRGRRRGGQAERKPKKVKPGSALVVVESPAKARTINKYLGANYIVKASVGHVRDLPKSKIGVDLEDGTFEPRLRGDRGQEEGRSARSARRRARSRPSTSHPIPIARARPSRGTSPRRSRTSTRTSGAS